MKHYVNNIGDKAVIRFEFGRYEVVYCGCAIEFGYFATEDEALDWVAEHGGTWKRER